MHSKTVNETLSLLGSSLKGLSQEEAEKRIKKHGLNKIELEEEGIFKILLRQFTNPFIIILILASLIALGFNKTKDFIFIIVAILINVLIGFYQEFKAKIKIKELLKFDVPLIKVLRNNELLEIPSDLITIGDVILLREGDIIPADLRFIETNNLLVDESVLIGESIPNEKVSEIVLPENTPIYERKNIGFGGTAIKRGLAKGIVYEVGLNTEVGKIYSKLKIKERKTPLIRTLTKFSKRLLIFIIFLLVLIFVLGFFQGKNIENLLILVISELVSAVPEGLPIATTIALVIGATILYKKKTLIRQLPAVEGLGSATFVCTDKTGTVTENKLTINQVFSLEQNFTDIIFALANDSDLERGDPFDIALLKWLEKNNKDFIFLREKYPRIWFYPFDVNLKLMATINKINDKDFLLIKGAFESLEKMAINSKDVKKLKEVHEEMTENGQRVLAFGYSEIKKIPDNISKVKIKLIGLVSFFDPPKETAKEAVKAMKEAGIKVIMVTGDNLKTAKKIAQMIGIHEDEKIVLEGKDLANYSENELKNLLKNVSVVARAIPEDKYKIVKLLQEDGEEVVVMGDGVNDMPAVKAADLGIAVSEGTQATKSVAKMVLLERDLLVISEAIKVGRRISHNLRKIILYLVSTSIGELLILFFAFVLSLPQPLYATQILWINLIAEGIQDKLLILTREEKWIFSLKPKTFSKWFLDKIQLYRIITFSLFSALINVFLFKYLLEKNFSLEIAITIVFLSVIFSQWAHGIQAIREHPFFYKPLENFRLNPYIFLILFFLGLPLQLIGVYFLSDFLYCQPISLLEWKYPIIIFFISFFFLEIRKWIEFKIIKIYNK